MDILLAAVAALLIPAQEPSNDLEGAPLPAGQLARMGSSRFRHAGELLALELGADGKTLVSTGSDRTVRIWNSETGQEQLRFEPSPRPARFLALAPDGLSLATSSGGKTIRLWNLADGKSLDMLEESVAEITGLAYVAGSPTWIAAARNDGAISLWDPATRTPLRAWFGHRGTVTALAVDRAGTRIASAGDDETGVIWDARTGALLARLSGRIAGVRKLAFSPDGARLACGGEGGAVSVWSAATGTLERSIVVGSSGENVNTLAFSPDGGLLAAGGSRGTLGCWDPASGMLKKSLPPASTGLSALAFLDGATLIAGESKGRISVWDLASGAERRPAPGHRAPVRALAFRPDGKQLASAAEDGSLWIWDAATGKDLFRLEGHRGEVTSLAYTRDGRRLASGGRDRTARIWDADAGRELQVLKGNENGLSALFTFPDDSRVVTGSYDGTLRLYDADGSELGRIPGHSNVVTGLAYAAGENRLLSCSYDATILSWDAASKKEGAKLVRPDAVLYAMAVSPDGQYVAAAAIGRLTLYSRTPEHILTLWELSTGQKVAESPKFECRGPALGTLEFSPDGRRLCLLREGAIRIWSPIDGQDAPVDLKAGPLSALRFSPDGRTVALGMADLTVGLWETTKLLPPAPQAAELGAEALARLWDDLAAPEAQRAMKASWALSNSPQAAVALLTPHLVPVNLAEVERLVAQLEDDSGAVRDRAARVLQSLGTSALLEKILERNPPLETALRIKALIAAQPQDRKIDPEMTRALRGIGVLEHASTPEARALIEKLAGGIDSARLTQAARAALERMKRKDAR